MNRRELPDNSATGGRGSSLGFNWGRLLVALVAFMGLCAPLSFAKQRIILHDLTFPQLKKGQQKRLADLKPLGRRVAPHSFATTEITFFLNKKGRVDSIGWSHPTADSLLFQPYSDSLLATRFETGKIHGKKSAFALAAKLIVTGNDLGGHGIVILPVSEEGELVDYQLALKSLQNHRYRTAALESFPSYFYHKPSVLSKRGAKYEFAIIQVQLDSAGLPENRSVYFTTNQNLGEMIQIAAGWAEYSPAEFEGNKVSSEGFIFVRFFHELNYPVAPWVKPANNYQPSGLHDLRIVWVPGRLFADVDPVQRGDAKLQLKMAMTFSAGVEKVAQLRVNGRGGASISRLIGVLGKIDTRLAQDKLKSIPFYPAFRIVLDSTAQNNELQYLNALGQMNLLPLDSVSYQLKTKFLSIYNTVHNQQAKSRRIEKR